LDLNLRSTITKKLEQRIRRKRKIHHLINYISILSKKEKKCRHSLLRIILFLVNLIKNKEKKTKL